MEKEQRIAWLRDEKFGMFIHWGLYSIPGGEWKGVMANGIAEWIMRRLKIPVAEYSKLAEEFNPTMFDAKEWVDIAKNAGMKYIVITAKHHDGFAMYHSRMSGYNIVNATPFGRDPMKELSEECRKAGLKLCFYYSHVQDWNEKDAVGNDWDFPEGRHLDFDLYLEQKVKPQLKELLTQYGPIGMIWFDTPGDITIEQSKSLVDFVHDIQPQCIVNHRVGNDQGDYIGFGDNESPAFGSDICWETCATINDTWGYKKKDNHWKSGSTLLKVLVDIVSKGGTYLLNVGPTAEGIIPEPSVRSLGVVGDWLRVNGEAIYQTKASPYPDEFDWGAITLKSGKMYLHFFHWPNEKFSLYGLTNMVKKAYLLAQPEKELEFHQKFRCGTGYNTLHVELPENAPDPDVSVLVLEIEGDTKVDQQLMQQPDRTIVLPAFRAEIHHDIEASGKKTLANDNDTIEYSSDRINQDKNQHISLSGAGTIQNWTQLSEWLSWDVQVVQPGSFDIEVISLIEKPYSWLGEEIGRWEGGHEITIEIAGQQVDFKVEEGERMENPRSLYFKRMRSSDAKSHPVSIQTPGLYTVKVKPKKLNFEKFGFKLHSIRLKCRE